MTKHGFYSIVQKQPGEFHIRARVHKDLANLVARVPLTGATIRASKEADYAYRVITGQEEKRRVMQFLGGTLDFSNFKNTVAQTADQKEKHEAYATVWHTMLDALRGFGQSPHKPFKMNHE